MRHDGRPGTVTRYAYDAYHLLLTGTTASSTANDVLPQLTTALAIDYQALQMTSVKNANQRIDEVLLDPLGDVIATSFRGWEWRDGASVEIGFAPLPNSRGGLRRPERTLRNEVQSVRIRSELFLFVN